MYIDANNIISLYIVIVFCPAFLSNVKLGLLQITVLQMSRDFSKTNSIFKVNFPCHRPNVFSKDFCMGSTN